MVKMKYQAIQKPVVSILQKSEKPLMAEEKTKAITIIFDLFLLVLIGTPIKYLPEFLEPNIRGFFCNDDSIRYPYKEPIVSSALVFSCGFSIALTVICICEFIHVFSHYHHHHGEWILKFIGKVYLATIPFLFGALATWLTADVMQYTLGILRPNFISVCDPDVNCYALDDRFVYNDDFTCNNSDPKNIERARLSFPSTEAAFAAYTMLYTALFLQKRMHFTSCRLFKPLLQFVLMILAAVVAVLQFITHEHHGGDLMFGFAMGAALSVYAAFVISDLFHHEHHHHHHDSTEEQDEEKKPMVEP